MAQKDELIVTDQCANVPVNFQEKPIKREAEANDMFLAMKDEPSWFLLLFGLAWPWHDPEIS